TTAELSSDAPWLTVAGTAALPSDLTLTLDPAGLPGGSHTARVTATAQGAVAAVLTVSLVVDAAPGLLVDPATLPLGAVDGGEPVTAALTVTSSDGSAVPVQATASGDWLTVDPGSSVTPAQLTVTADPGGLTLGEHTAEVLITSPDLPDAVVPVVLEVREPASDFDVVYSLDRKRGDAQPLAGTTVTGDIYPFLSPVDGVSSTSWWLDDPERSGLPLRV